MIILTQDLMKKIYPNGNAAVLTAFVNKQAVMSDILAVPERAALCFANMFAETSGFALRGLSEDIHYTPQRMAEVWPRRFPGGAADVERKYGTSATWYLKAFDDIYGRTELGNRPGTSDGSTYIGRGGPQLTGRTEYENIGNAIGMDFLINPELACKPELQPDIAAAYWKQKNFNEFIGPEGDTNIVAARERWNGGTNGLKVVESEFSRMLKLLDEHNPVTAASNVQLPTASIDPVLKSFQAELIEMGYHEVGDADGMMGGKTMGAIKAFMNDRGADTKAEYPSDALTAEMNAATSEGWHRPIAPGRAFAQTEELAPKIASVAPTAKAGFLSKISAWFSGAGAVTTAAVQFMPTAHDTATPYLAMIHEYFDKIPGWVPMGVVGAIAIATAIQTTKANQATTADYQKGKIN